MITRHPLGRQDLRIKRRDKVLEIGPGHDPMFRSDVIADKFPHDDTHRCGKVLIYPHQQFIEADGEQLPFEKDAFDYVICNQVLEHADNPARFIEESENLENLKSNQGMKFDAHVSSVGFILYLVARLFQNLRKQIRVLSHVFYFTFRIRT